VTPVDLAGWAAVSSGPRHLLDRQAPLVRPSERIPMYPCSPASTTGRRLPVRGYQPLFRGYRRVASVETPVVRPEEWVALAEKRARLLCRKIGYRDVDEMISESLVALVIVCREFDPEKAQGSVERVPGGTYHLPPKGFRPPPMGPRPPESGLRVYVPEVPGLPADREHRPGRPPTSQLGPYGRGSHYGTGGGQGPA
jgi:hypothetical protein